MKEPTVKRFLVILDLRPFRSQTNIKHPTGREFQSQFPYVTFNDKDPPWMTNYLKYKIHCKKGLYLKYLKHGKRNCDYTELQRFTEEISKDISKSKEHYYNYLAKKLNKPKASPKTYWALIKTFVKKMSKKFL